MPAFGEDVVAVVEQPVQDIVLIGHSMGGDVIVEAALRLPGRVRGLVWVDTYSDPRRADDGRGDRGLRRAVPGGLRRDDARFVREMFLPGSDPDLVEQVVTDMSAAPPEIAIDAIGYSIGNIPAIVEGLRRLALPAVAINPDDRPTDIEGLARHGSGDRRHAGVGHFLMMEDPPAFNRLLTETIERFRA